MKLLLIQILYIQIEGLINAVIVQPGSIPEIETICKTMGQHYLTFQVIHLKASLYCVQTLIKFLLLLKLFQSSLNKSKINILIQLMVIKLEEFPTSTWKMNAPMAIGSYCCSLIVIHFPFIQILAHHQLFLPLYQKKNTKGGY